MELQINKNKIEYLIISEELRGYYNHKDGSVGRFLLCDSLLVEFPAPTWIEKTFFGKTQTKAKWYPKAFYEDGLHWNEFILEKDLDKKVYLIKDGEIYTKPFIVPVYSGQKIGGISFETSEEMRTYVDEKFGYLNLETIEFL